MQRKKQSRLFAAFGLGSGTRAGGRRKRGPDRAIKKPRFIKNRRSEFKLDEKSRWGRVFQRYKRNITATINANKEKYIMDFLSGNGKTLTRDMKALANQVLYELPAAERDLLIGFWVAKTTGKMTFMDVMKNQIYPYIYTKVSDLVSASKQGDDMKSKINPLGLKPYNPVRKRLNDSK